MGKELDELAKIFDHKNKKSQTMSLQWANVTKVDWEEKTCEAEGLDDQLAFYDILLGIGSFDVKPKIGSLVLLGMINDDETTPVLISAEEIEEMILKTKIGVFIRISNDSITVEAINKPININSGNSSVAVTTEGVDITSDKAIRLNGGFEALYNKVNGVPISDFSQIGSSNIVKIG